MAATNGGNNLRITLDTKNCNLRPDEIAKIETNLGLLRTMVADFPVCDLYLFVARHERSNEFQVKASLVLTGRTLFTGDHDSHVHPAFLRCVRKLVSKLRGYLEDLENKSEMAKQEEGTRREIIPEAAPDAAQLAAAVSEGDYAAFRRAAYVYEGPVRERTTRWINRYPELLTQLGNGLSVNDAVEEVFLNAFERYGERPQAVRIGQWLEDLIDPSLRELADDPDREREQISLARTVQEMGTS